MHDSLGWAPERGEEMFHNYTETKAVAGHPRIQVPYWMHRARRDLVLQSSLSSMQTSGTFGLRSSVRPNPIASSIVQLIAIDGTTLQVRGLACLDGTPLIDLKPEHTTASD